MAFECKSSNAQDADDLHRMAMDAVQGRSAAPDAFEGLME